MVMARGGNRKTKYHICHWCGKKKMYIRSAPDGYGDFKLVAHCQNCQGTDMRRATIDRLIDEEDAVYTDKDCELNEGKNNHE